MNISLQTSPGPHISAAPESDGAERESYLHIMPLSSRLMNAVQNTHAFLQKSAPKEGWQGHFVRHFAKGIAFCGYLLNFPVALIEFVALGIIGLAGGIVATTGFENPALEKFSIKCLSYSLHSFVVFSIQCIALSKLTNDSIFMPKTFTQAAILSEGAYLGSCAFANYVGALWFKGTKDPSLKTWPLNALREGAPQAIVEVLGAFLRDHSHLSLHMIDLNGFYNQLPEAQQTLLRNFNILRITEPGYMQQYYPIIIHFLIQANILAGGEGAQAIEIEGTNEIELNIYTDLEKSYQAFLKDCIKEAYEKMIEEDFVKFLDKDNHSGQAHEMLATFDPSATIPLAHMAELIEISKGDEPFCPEEFKHESLSSYNNPSRRERIMEAYADWFVMDPSDKELLIERLIKGSDFELQGRVVKNQSGFDHLYKETASLAADIHQGKLMSVLTFDVATQDFSSVNYFGKAWQEAAQESQAAIPLEAPHGPDSPP